MLCLDKSGSMSGKPWNALEQGAKMIAKSLYSSDEYERCSVCLYDDSAKASEPKNLDEFSRLFWGGAGGSTNFVAVFKYI
jgi:uncharacterized protein with von Willebrand factor type A (vWA) domain